MRARRAELAAPQQSGKSIPGAAKVKRVPAADLRIPPVLLRATRRLCSRLRVHV